MMTKLIKVLLGVVFLFVVGTGFAFAAGSDVNNDGQVNAADLIEILQNWGLTGVRRQDVNGDQKVNSIDVSYVIKDWGTTPSTPTPTPTHSPGPATAEWTQFGHDPQRTSYNPENISLPWKYKWQWNGADSSGRGVSDWVSMKIMVQPITGGGRVYVVAGGVGGSADRVYTLAKTNGSVLWNAAPGGELSATPAYSEEYLFVPSDSGRLYKLNAQNGNTVASFQADSPLKTPPLLVGARVYVTSENGTLYAIDKNTMNQVWAYSAGAQAATMPSYSATRDIVIFNDRELYVHAVNSNGSRVWRVRPTNKTPFYGHPSADDLGANQGAFDYGWPVVADATGIVFVRYRLHWDSLWNRTEQPLFALDLDNGEVAFTPEVGNAAFEGDNATQLIMGPQPAIRRLDSGKEVAYIIWRSSQVSDYYNADARWDATMGEMVLDNNTVSGYQAGDLRFVSTGFIPTDESGPVTAAGNFVFHGHWLVMCSSDLGSRSGGDSYTNAMGKIAPFVIWAQAGGAGCSFNASTRWCNSLYTATDNRGYGAGFYVLYDEPERDWVDNPFVVVSDGMILAKSIDGAIFVLE